MRNPCCDSSMKLIKELISVLLHLLEEQQELNLDLNHSPGSQTVFDTMREDGIMEGNSVTESGVQVGISIEHLL